MLNKRALQRLGHDSRPANVSSRSRLGWWGQTSRSRLGLGHWCLVPIPGICSALCLWIRTGGYRHNTMQYGGQWTQTQQNTVDRTHHN